MVIRMRHTRSKTKSRRSHHALTAPNLSTCSNCGAHHRPHHMCLDCGFYKGRQVMDLAAQKKAREERIAKKKELIKTQHESIAPTESDAVAEAAPTETESPKEDK